MRPLVIVIAALLAGACGDNQKPATQDAGTSELVPCLDEPMTLARPPVDRLPCELLPPGFQAP